jgi:hypothetical protein
VLVFTSPEGAPLRHSNFYRRAWMPALKAVGLPGVHLHDLRHTGNQFSADVVLGMPGEWTVTALEYRRPDYRTLDVPLDYRAPARSCRRDREAHHPPRQVAQTGDGRPGSGDLIVSVGSLAGMSAFGMARA